MVFNVTYTICEGPKIIAYKFQSVTSFKDIDKYANCQYDIVRQFK